MKNNGSLLIRSPYSPVIYYDSDTLTKTLHLIDKVDTEVQWFHRVQRIVVDNEIQYRLFDIVIPEQEVSQASVESSPTLMYKLSKEMQSLSGGLNEEFNTLCRELTCWCHSHVNMGVSPSGTDEQQFKEQIEHGEKGGQPGPQIMLIWNKRSEYFSRVLDRELGLVFQHVPIRSGNNNIDFSYVDDAVKSKLKKKTYAASSHYTQRYEHDRPWQGGVSTYPRNSGGSEALRARAESPTPSKTTYQARMEATQEGKSTEKALGGTQTDGSSSGRPTFARIPHSEWETLFTLLGKLNNTQSAHEEAEKITDILDKYLDDKDFDILDTLLFGEMTLAQATMVDWLIHDNEDDFVKAKEVFNHSLIGGEIDPPELLAEAIATTMLIRNVKTTKGIETVLEQWFAETELDKVDYKPYTQNVTA